MVVLWWGKRYAGKVDVVPDVFHVETLFDHAFGVPLFPNASFLMLVQEGVIIQEPIPLRIPINLKSVAMTYLRAMTFALAGVSFLWSPIALSSAANWVAPLIVSAASAFVCVTLCFSRHCTRASFARACRLVREAKLGEDWLGAVAQSFGQPVPKEASDEQKEGARKLGRD